MLPASDASWRWGVAYQLPTGGSDYVGRGSEPTPALWRPAFPSLLSRTSTAIASGTPAVSMLGTATVRVRRSDARAGVTCYWLGCARYTGLQDVGASDVTLTNANLLVGSSFVFYGTVDGDTSFPMLTTAACVAAHVCDAAQPRRVPRLD